MSTQNAKIEFLARMEVRICLFSDLAMFLIGEGIVSGRDIAEVMKQPPNARPAEFYVLLKNSGAKFHLISWEWVMLPVEIMKLTIVSHNGVKEFTWSE